MMRQSMVAAVALVLLAPFRAAAQWTTAESGVDVTLTGVVDTSTGFFACGHEGIILNRTAPRTWEKVLDGGPTGNGNSLYTCSTTDDGERLWFAGSSGAIGEMDVNTGAVTDHSAPDDSGDNINAIQSKGPADAASIYTATDSGLWFYNFDDGAEGEWNYVTPGSGSSINGASMYGPREGHIVDGNADSFMTTDGKTFNKIGIPDADSTPYDVDSNGETAVWVAGGSGFVYRYDGANWNSTKVTPTTDARLNVIDITTDNNDGYTAGASGVVFRLVEGSGAGTWNQEETPTESNLKGLAFNSDTAVAVGTSGTIIEKE